MTNPTSNFGWQMPTPTDLVTDLPADFEVFGQAVDTSLADLQGGTTGQILSKTTNADMDFTWITNDIGDITAVNVTAPITGGGSSGAVTIGVSAASTAAAGVVQLSDSTSTTSSVLASTPTATKSAYDLADAAIAKSVLTTAGDVLYRNATVPVRLGIGTAGQVLKVNSGATAPEWGTASSGLTFIKTVTFSNVASTTTSFDSIFTTTYLDYMVVIDNIYAATPADDLQIQMRYGGATETGGNYFGVAGGFSIYGATAISGSNALSHVTLATGSGSSTNAASGVLYFSKVGNGSQVPGFYGLINNIHEGVQYANGGQTQTARVYDGFLLKSASTNISGTVTVYGLAKS